MSEEANNNELHVSPPMPPLHLVFTQDGFVLRRGTERAFMPWRAVDVFANASNSHRWNYVQKDVNTLYWPDLHYTMTIAHIFGTYGTNAFGEPKQ